MKRSGPPERRTPLRATTPLPRGENPLRRTEMPRGEAPLRVTRLTARPKPMSKPEETARRLLLARSNGMCEAQIRGLCTFLATDYQHRKRRPHCTKAELWATSNAVACCRRCHDFIGSAGGRPVAHSLGLHVESYEIPAATPVRIRGRDVLLDDHGTYTPYTPTEGAA